MVATRIDWEDSDDNIDFILSGTVADLIPGVSFTINGVLVLITTNTQFAFGNASDLKNGFLVEAEGQLDANQNLVAVEIALNRRLQPHR